MRFFLEKNCKNLETMLLGDPHWPPAAGGFGSAEGSALRPLRCYTHLLLV